MGTGQDMLDLLGGDSPNRDSPNRDSTSGDSTSGTAKLAELERRVAAHLGFEHVLTSVGQVYPRSLDYDVLTALVQLAAGPSSLATTIRLMAARSWSPRVSSPGRSARARCRTR